MTPAQLTTLAAHIRASTDPAVVAALANGNDNEIARLYNRDAVPAFIVWRTNVTCQETTDAWVGTDIDGMSALNMQRLQMLLASGPVCNMSRADRRAWAENPFGTNVNNASRVAMRAIWKRAVRVVERVFATGTGSDATPGALVYEGSVTGDEIASALRP
jgi:hypothetical protein